MDKQTLQMVQKKIDEIQLPNEEDPDILNIGETYKEIIGKLSSNEFTLDQLKVIGKDVIDLNILFEQDLYVQKKRIKEDTIERDQLLQKEYAMLQERKAKQEIYCRELQANLQELTTVCAKYPETEQQNRTTMSTKFHDDLKDVKLKIDTEEKEGKQFEEENIQLREKFQQLVNAYEAKEKEFWDKVKVSEVEQQEASKQCMEKYEEIKLTTNKAIQDKLLIETAQKGLNEKKAKLSIYKNKQTEFIETIEKSTQTINQLRNEFVKFAYSVQEIEDKANQCCARAEKSNLVNIAIVQKNNDAKKQIEQLEQEKNKIRAEIVLIHQKKKIEQFIQNNSQAQ